MNFKVQNLLGHPVGTGLWFSFAASYAKGKWLFFGLITFGYGEEFVMLVITRCLVYFSLFLGTSFKTTFKKIAKQNVAVFWTPNVPMRKSDHEKGSNKNWPILATGNILAKKSAGKPLVIKPTVSQYFSQLTNFSVFSNIFRLKINLRNFGAKIQKCRESRVMISRIFFNFFGFHLNH